MSSEKYIERSFCTTRDAAQMLGISLRTAQLWSESGLLEAWKTSGGHRRISRLSIERLLSGRAGDLPTPTDPGDDSGSGALKVMVVEDDPDLRRLYEIKLKAWPMKPTVVTVGDGYEALVLLGLKRPDMLIADLRMPGLDSFRMLRTIQGTPELAGMKIVFVSGLAPKDIEQRSSLPAGIPILPKPVPFDRLAGLAALIVDAREATATEGRNLPQPPA
ncbi:MAG: response regulator [Rhodocyclales bacterium]|nr:response regulator [Rhodocyclales bacterium]